MQTASDIYTHAGQFTIHMLYPGHAWLVNVLVMLDYFLVMLDYFLVMLDRLHHPFFSRYTQHPCLCRIHLNFGFWSFPIVSLPRSGPLEPCKRDSLPNTGPRRTEHRLSWSSHHFHWVTRSRIDSNRLTAQPNLRWLTHTWLIGVVNSLAHTIRPKDTNGGLSHVRLQYLFVSE